MKAQGFEIEAGDTIEFEFDGIVREAVVVRVTEHVAVAQQESVGFGSRVGASFFTEWYVPAERITDVQLRNTPIWASHAARGAAGLFTELKSEAEFVESLSPVQDQPLCQECDTHVENEGDVCDLCRLAWVEHLSEYGVEFEDVY